jgi:hypothetical protein
MASSWLLACDVRRAGSPAGVTETIPAVAVRVRATAAFFAAHAFVQVHRLQLAHVAGARLHYAVHIGNSIFKQEQPTKRDQFVKNADFANNPKL